MPYDRVCPPLFFLMNYCSIHFIQSIGKVSKFRPTQKREAMWQQDQKNFTHFFFWWIIVQYTTWFNRLAKSQSCQPTQKRAATNQKRFDVSKTYNSFLFVSSSTNEVVLRTWRLFWSFLKDFHWLGVFGCWITVLNTSFFEKQRPVFGLFWFAFIRTRTYSNR